MWEMLKKGARKGIKGEFRYNLINPMVQDGATALYALDVGVRERSSLANNNNVTCTVARNATNIQT
jgi:hypothetical protein